MAGLESYRRTLKVVAKVALVSLIQFFSLRLNRRATSECQMGFTNEKVKPLKDALQIMKSKSSNNSSGETLSLATIKSMDRGLKIRLAWEVLMAARIVERKFIARKRSNVILWILEVGSSATAGSCFASLTIHDRTVGKA